MRVSIESVYVHNQFFHCEYICSCQLYTEFEKNEELYKLFFYQWEALPSLRNTYKGAYVIFTTDGLTRDQTRDPLVFKLNSLINRCNRYFQTRIW